MGLEKGARPRVQPPTSLPALRVDDFQQIRQLLVDSYHEGVVNAPIVLPLSRSSKRKGSSKMIVSTTRVEEGTP